MLAVLRRIIQIIVFAVFALIVLVVVLISLGIPIDLDRFRSPFEALASQSLQRDTRLSGDLVLVPTWSFTVEAGGLQVANPPGFGDEDFASLELVRIRVDVLALLLRRLEVAEFTAENGTLRLIRNDSGQANWEFGSRGAESANGGEPDDEEAMPRPEQNKEPAWKKLLPTDFTLENLRLRNISASYADAVTSTEHELVLEELRGTASTLAPLEIQLRGSLDEYEVSASITGGDPQNLMSGADPWPMIWKLDIGPASFEIEALIDEHDWGMPQLIDLLLAGTTRPFASLDGGRVGQVTLRVGGEQLDELGNYLTLSLPPWGPYRFEAQFEAFGGGLTEAEVEFVVGGSELTGKLKLEQEHEPPRLALSLAAPTIQLADFALRGWSALGEESSESDAPSPDTSDSPSESDRALLSAEVMQSLDATLDVRVDRVASGADWLGAGKLEASLQDGRFTLAPLQIDVPGGGLVVESELEVTQAGATAAVRLNMRRFDYGVLARRAKPGSDMAGLLAMVVDLRASAPSTRELMQHASGRFDVAVFPERLEAGIIDLWAVNLAAAALPAVAGEESKVNCLLVMMDMEDGVMSEKTLLIDTSKITVHGRAKFDFHTQRVDVMLAPRAKRPEFFSAATPVRIEGSFEDFGLDIRTSDLIGSFASIVTSPVRVPIQRIFTSSPDPKDAETCMAALKREP